MSVLVSKRYIAKTEFLKNLTILQKYILRWCIKQPPKYKSFGVQALYDYIESARKFACLGNSIYVKCVKSDNDEASLNNRIQCFKKSKYYLAMLNYHIPTILDVYNLSIQKACKWSEIINKTQALLDGVIKSDKKKLL